MLVHSCRRRDRGRSLSVSKMALPRGTSMSPIIIVRGWLDPSLLDVVSARLVAVLCLRVSVKTTD